MINMKVECKANLGTDLLKTTYEIGYTGETIFDLEKHKLYIVYGICHWKNSLHYLIEDENHLPSWFPVELFTITDNQLPLEWYFSYYEKEEISAIWGYKEIVVNESHFDSLMEREKNALNTFWTRKHEINTDLNY